MKRLASVVGSHQDRLPLQSEAKGLVFDVLSFAVHDGPGCRTLVFLKGCPLECRWCSNPEGQRPYPELMHSNTRCERCHKCLQACPFCAISVDEEGSLSISRDICLRNGCLQQTSVPCVQACNTGAMTVVGTCMTVGQLLDRMERERKFWRRSGGVTLSGGEPMYQPQFAVAFLEGCHQRYIHTAIETCGHVAWEYYEQALAHLDWVFYDLKLMDAEKHRQYTGLSNNLILANLERLAEEQQARGTPRVIVRIPLIPGYNDATDNIQQIGAFLAELGLNEVNMLPFHRLGASKYERLGMVCECQDLLPPTTDSLKDVQRELERHALKVYTGSRTPF